MARRRRRRTRRPRYAGLGWLIAGFIFYLLYRRKLGEPLRKTVRAPVVIMAAQLEYRNILVPVAPGYPSDEAMDVACRLARERGARIVAMTVIHVPLELPLDAYLPDEVQEANEQLDEARAIGESYGVNVIARIVRARNSGRAIVDEADAPERGDHRHGRPAPRSARRRAARDLRRHGRLRDEARADPCDGRCGEDVGVNEAYRRVVARLRLRCDRPRLRDPRADGAEGGGTVGFAVGALFVALGAAGSISLRRQSGS